MTVTFLENLKSIEAMKKVMGYAVAGLFGGLLVLAAAMFYIPEMVNQHQAQSVSTTQKYGSLVSNRGSSALPNDFRTAAQRSMETVVHIKSSAAPKQVQGADPFSFFFGSSPYGDFGPKVGTGSGVIYSEDGFIITNNHVIDFADEVEVTLYDNRKYKASVIGRDEKTDLAVLKIEATDLPAIRIGNSDDTQVGDWVLAVGNPFELTSTVTAGIVSAKGRSLHMMSKNAIESFIQTDAAVNPGNSGGALVNTQGELIGINTAIASMTGSYAGYSFAIPVNIVTRVADNLIQYGSAKRGTLGIMIADMDSDLSKELMIDISQGAYISELVPGGAAQLAGLLPDDVIVQVNNHEIKNVPDLMAVVGESNVGDLLKIKVNRHGKIKEIDVKLKG